MGGALAVSPSVCHKAQKLALAIKPGHQRSGCSDSCASPLVKPLKRSAAGNSLACSSAFFLPVWPSFNVADFWPYLGNFSLVKRREFGFGQKFLLGVWSFKQNFFIWSMLKENGGTWGNFVNVYIP